MRVVYPLRYLTRVSVHTHTAVDSRVCNWSDGGMKLYAETPARRTRQMIADLLFLGWLVLWVYIAGVVHDSTMELVEPSEQVELAGERLSDGLSGTRDFLADLPLVGSGVTDPLDTAIAATDQLSEGGRQSIGAIESLAFWLRLSIGASPILIVAAFYLPGRVRFVQRATQARQFVDSNDDLDLLALRALSHQPLPMLTRISEDPAGGWRSGDPDVIWQLADLELKASGLQGLKEDSSWR